MIEFVRGNLFDQPSRIRVNTVNCAGVMGAGIALEFKQRYPEMYRDYVRACKRGEVRPGKLHEWRSLEGDWVINFPTKRDWRDPSRIEDIEAGLDALREYLMPLGPVSVALPALGCGHGGLNWSEVSRLIEAKLGDLASHFYVFEPAASRSAARREVTVSSEDIVAAADRGFSYFPAKPEGNGIAKYPRFLKGPHSLVEGPWMAIAPSRHPDARELQALERLATELRALAFSPVLALVHQNKSSEAIAELLTTAGASVLLIEPSGILSRKPAKQSKRDDSSHRPAILSVAPLHDKWNRHHARQANALLRANAGAMLISNPQPDWFLKAAKDWNDIPVAYFRYDEIDQNLKNALAERGAKPLGRRTSGESPGLNLLLAAWEQLSPESGANPLPVAEGRPLTLELKDYSFETWETIVAIITEAHPSSVEVRIRVDDETMSAALEERLERLRVRPEQKTSASLPG